MKLLRMFSTEQAKGTPHYLDTQKKYELLRTILYFAISLALFVAGYIQTHSRANLLTIIAVLGCLPASKSAVSTIMYFRYKSASEKTMEEVEKHCQGLSGLYDCLFTSYKINFSVAHLAVRGNTVCGYTEEPSFDETAFNQHIQDILKLDGHKEVTVKIFTDLSKYINRLEQMKELPPEEEKTEKILATIKSVIL